jgi:subtilisin-like proprotein convertase family protein
MKVYRLIILICLITGLNPETVEAQVYNLNAGLNGQTISLCRGLFRDSGGGDITDCSSTPTIYDYSANENRTVTFCSNNGKPIRISFIWWDLETGFDYIFVYDGPTTASPLLNAFTGSGQNFQVPNFYTSSGTCITIRFQSDNTINWCGWEAIIGCEPEVCGAGNNPPASDNCTNAPIICDFDGYCGNTSGWYTPDNASIGTTGSSLFCGSIENNSWVSFIADATSASFRITSNNCIFPVASGIQARIFATTTCNQFTPVSNCVSQAGGPGTFNISTTTALVPGQRYYIMIDGFAGNVCDYTITPVTGVRLYNITGPPNNTICANQTTTLTLIGAPPGSTFQWSPASAIIGSTTGQSITANPGNTNTTYTVQVTSPSGCGNQSVNYNLRVSDLTASISGNTNLCSGQSTTLTATATPQPPTISFSNYTAPVNIPDNNATGITSNINVSGIPGTAGGSLLSVCLDINHTYVGDLQVLLRCPNNTTINLSMRRGGAGDNYSGTCFAGSGPAISTGTPPFTGTFTPEQALSNLAACTANGTWSLIVRDREGGDVGQLLGWSITFQNNVTYSWSPGTGLNTTSGPTVTANPTTTTAYTVTATDFLGCSTQTQVTVNVLTPNGVRLAPTGPVCSGTTLNFQANPTGGNGTYTINWTAGTTPPVNGNGNIFSFTPTNTTGANIQVPVTLSVTSGGLTCTQAFNPTILPEVTPTFNPIPPICQGDPAPTLPGSSTNGITGSWSPATVSNTTSGNYIFTPNPGQCATQASLSVTVNTPVTPSFNAIPAICQGATPPTLPTTSTNGISGTWSPATVNNSATTTYTFTPNNGQCALQTTLTVNVNPSITPSFAPVAPLCQGDPAPTLPNTSTNGISGTWSPATVSNTSSGTYTFTPSGGQCATQTTLNVTVNPPTIPTFNAIPPICEGTTSPVLPTTSTNGITGTWNPATVSNTASNIYTFTPNAGQCASQTTLGVTVNSSVTPTFNPIAPICQGDPAPTLPNTSTNGILGTWSPATVSNTSSGTYTFTPTGGQCATQTNMNVTVNTPVTPSFNAIPAICQGATPPTLPTTSTNGISGTWSPATVNNSATTTYTFSPAPGQCAVPTTLVVNVNNNTTPIFNPIPALCSGDPPPVLPAISINGISGTWSPATVNNTSSGTYTFTPTGGQCAVQTTLNVNVNPRITPVFSPIPPFCEGATAPVLPSTSNNGISGTWSPAVINNSISGTYTFTPGAGECANQATLNTTVTPRPITTVIYHD